MNKKTLFLLILGLSTIALLVYLYFVIAKSTQSYDVIERNGYKIKHFHRLLSPNECQELMKFSDSKGMEQSSVLSYGTGKDVDVDTNSRKSKTLWISDKDHPVASKLAKIASIETGKPINHQEMLQIVRYDEGGKFNPHFDACDIDDPEYKNRINHGAGQRYATLLVYLNDEYDGGETDFVEMNVSIVPKQGDAIFFWDTDDKEQILPLSKHMGNQVKNGNKWICTKWVHHQEWK